MAEETTLAAVASEVESAREALLEAAQSAPDKWWTTDELLKAARDGWRGTIVMMAIDDLIRESALEADSRWRLRLVA